MTDYDLRPPIRFWFEGDEKAAKGYIPRARHLVSQMIRQMEIGEVNAMDWHYREEGVYYELHKFGSQHVALIRVEPVQPPAPPQIEPEIPRPEEPKPLPPEPIPEPVIVQPEFVIPKPSEFKWTEPEPFIPEEPEQKVPLIRELVARIMTGHVYLDANWSKEEDAGDSPMPKVTIKLLDEDDSELDETQTNEDGDFSFIMDAEGVERALPMSLKLKFVRNDELPESHQALEGKDRHDFDLDAAVAIPPHEVGEGQRVTWVLQNLGNFGFAPLTGYLWAGAKINPLPYSEAEWGAAGDSNSATLNLEATTYRSLTEYNGASRNLIRVPNGSGSMIGVIQGTVTESSTVKGTYANPPTLNILLTEPAVISGIQNVTGVIPLAATGSGEGDGGVLVYDNNTLTWTAPGSVAGVSVTVVESGRYDIQDGADNVLSVMVDVEQLPEGLERDESVTVVFGDAVGNGGFFQAPSSIDEDQNANSTGVMFAMRVASPASVASAVKDYRFVPTGGIEGSIHFIEGEVRAYQALPGPGLGQFRVKTLGGDEEYWHPDTTPIALPSHACWPVSSEGSWGYSPAEMVVTPAIPSDPVSVYAFVTQVMDDLAEVQPYSGGPFVYRKDKAPDCQAFVCVDPQDPAKTAVDLALPTLTVSGINELTGWSVSYETKRGSQAGIKQRVPDSSHPFSGTMTPSGDWYVYWNNQLILLDPDHNATLDGTALQGFRGEDPTVNEYAFVSVESAMDSVILDPMRNGQVIYDHGHQHQGQIKPGIYRLDIDVYKPGFVGGE